MPAGPSIVVASMRSARTKSSALSAKPCSEVNAATNDGMTCSRMIPLAQCHSACAATNGPYSASGTSDATSTTTAAQGRGSARSAARPPESAPITRRVWRETRAPARAPATSPPRHEPFCACPELVEGTIHTRPRVEPRHQEEHHRAVGLKRARVVDAAREDRVERHRGNAGERRSRTASGRSSRPPRSCRCRTPISISRPKISCTPKSL